MCKWRNASSGSWWSNYTAQWRLHPWEGRARPLQQLGSTPVPHGLQLLGSPPPAGLRGGLAWLRPPAAARSQQCTYGRHQYQLSSRTERWALLTGERRLVPAVQCPRLPAWVPWPLVSPGARWTRHFMETSPCNTLTLDAPPCGIPAAGSVQQWRASLGAACHCTRCRRCSPTARWQLPLSRCHAQSR